MLPSSAAGFGRSRLKRDQVCLVQQDRRRVERLTLRVVIFRVPNDVVFVSVDAIVVFGPGFDNRGSG